MGGGIRAEDWDDTGSGAIRRFPVQLDAGIVEVVADAGLDVRFDQGACWRRRGRERVARLERDVSPLGLLVDGNVERVVVQAEADRHQMWLGVAADSGEVGDADKVEETALRLGQHGGTIEVTLYGRMQSWPKLPN